MGGESLFEPATKRPEEPAPPEAHEAAPGEKSRWRPRRIVVVVGIGALLLLLSGAISVYVITERLGNNIERVPDTFESLDESTRPPSTNALTFLLVGTDSRTDVGAGAGFRSYRSEVLMLAQVAPDRESATVVSIPNSSWVDVPGRGADRLAAAYTVGGPALLIKTVENLTALRVDHFAVIDFAGFRSMVDAVGGIDVVVSPPLSDAVPGFRRGMNHLNGAGALVYVRHRLGGLDADLERGQRQQNALRAMLATVASNGTLSDPVALYNLLNAASRSLGVDDTLSNGGLRALALEMNDLAPGRVVFLRVPTAEILRERGGSVVRLDARRAPELWDAMRQGTVDGYAERNRGDVLGMATP